MRVVADRFVETDRGRVRRSRHGRRRRPDDRVRGRAVGSVAMGGAMRPASAACTIRRWRGSWTTGRSGSRSASKRGARPDRRRGLIEGSRRPWLARRGPSCEAVRPDRRVGRSGRPPGRQEICRAGTRLVVIPEADAGYPCVVPESPQAPDRKEPFPLENCGIAGIERRAVSALAELFEEPRYRRQRGPQVVGIWGPRRIGEDHRGSRSGAGSQAQGFCADERSRSSPRRWRTPSTGDRSS